MIAFPDRYSRWCKGSLRWVEWLLVVSFRNSLEPTLWSRLMMHTHIPIRFQNEWTIYGTRWTDAHQVAVNHKWNYSRRIDIWNEKISYFLVRQTSYHEILFACGKLLIHFYRLNWLPITICFLLWIEGTLISHASTLWLWFDIRWMHVSFVNMRANAGLCSKTFLSPLWQFVSIHGFMPPVKYLNPTKNQLFSTGFRRT